MAAAALTRIEQLGAAAAKTVLGAPAGADGWRQAAVPIESIEHTAGVLLAFVADTEVLAPRELRAEVRWRAEGVLALYANSPADGSEADRS